MATREIFRGCDIAMAGPLDGHDDRGWKVSDVERWVTCWGGTFSHALDPGVTHLLATEDQFRQRAPRVREVMTTTMRGVHVVTPDWLEDSINCRRRLPERPYSLRRAQREEDARRRRRERARRGIEMSEKSVDPNCYHVYRDATFFEYNITLTRDDEASGNVGQKYILTLWESNAKPHLYHFVAKFLKRPGSAPCYFRPSDSPRKLAHELALFKDFFRRRTGLLWDDRVRRAGTKPQRFQYTPPTGGKPIGLIDGRAPSIKTTTTKRKRGRSPDADGDDDDDEADDDDSRVPPQAKEPRLSNDEDGDGDMQKKNRKHDDELQSAPRTVVVVRPARGPLISSPPGPFVGPGDAWAGGEKKKKVDGEDEDEEEEGDGEGNEGKEMQEEEEEKEEVDEGEQDGDKGREIGEEEEMWMKKGDEEVEVEAEDTEACDFEGAERASEKVSMGEDNTETETETGRGEDQ
ncbi:hypothetical protein F4809DRAFT_665591 [Biscogniauxia mediterranea]|nr:hypothetical protein F4809DRAFT_665591 [Biscogniauxia mediterranea]